MQALAVALMPRALAQPLVVVLMPREPARLLTVCRVVAQPPHDRVPGMLAA